MRKEYFLTLYLCQGACCEGFFLPRKKRRKRGRTKHLLPSLFSLNNLAFFLGGKEAPSLRNRGHNFARMRKTKAALFSYQHIFHIHKMQEAFLKAVLRNALIHTVNAHKQEVVKKSAAIFALTFLGAFAQSRKVYSTRNYMVTAQKYFPEKPLVCYYGTVFFLELLLALVQPRAMPRVRSDLIWPRHKGTTKLQ